MSAGALRQRVVIQAATDTADAQTGALARTWTTLATVWASIEPLRMREALLASQLLEQADTRIRIRWAPELANLDTAARVRWTDVAGRREMFYDIVSVIEPKMRRKELELLCKSGTSEG